MEQGDPQANHICEFEDGKLLDYITNRPPSYPACSLAYFSAECNCSKIKVTNIRVSLSQSLKDCITVRLPAEFP